MRNWECWRRAGPQTDEQTGLLYRYKYKIFAEQGDDNPDGTVLIISQQRQTRLDENADWLDQDKDARAGAATGLADLSLFIDAGKPAAEPAPAPAAASEAGCLALLPARGTERELRVVDAGEGKMYLTIPEAFEQAWKNTGVALRNSGLQVTGGNEAKGFYQVTGGALQRAGEERLFLQTGFLERRGGNAGFVSNQPDRRGQQNRTDSG